MLCLVRLHVSVLPMGHLQVHVLKHGGTDTIKRQSVPVTVPVVAQKVGRGIALLLHDHGTRRGSVVSSMPRPLFNPGKDPVTIVQGAGWAPAPVWAGGKSRPT